MTELTVEGMTCEHCQKAVKSALESVAGVTSAQVDLESGRARVEGSADLVNLVAAIEDEGYGAKPAG